MVIGAGVLGIAPGTERGGLERHDLPVVRLIGPMLPDARPVQASGIRYTDSPIKILSQN